MFQALLLLFGIFAAGFFAGYGLRAAVSRRRRKRVVLLDSSSRVRRPPPASTVSKSPPEDPAAVPVFQPSENRGK
jgi:hypothetical protein